MSRRDTIWKWVFYTAGVLLLLLLQGLALDHISLLHVHPYLPPVMVAVLAMFEGAYGGMGVALAMGLLFDLTQPGLIPCFHILVFLLAALAAAAVANYLITPGLLCAVLMGAAALVITNGLQILLMTYQQGVAFSAGGAGDPGDTAADGAGLSSLPLGAPADLLRVSPLKGVCYEILSGQIPAGAAGIDLRDDPADLLRRAVQYSDPQRIGL